MSGTAVYMDPPMQPSSIASNKLNNNETPTVSEGASKPEEIEVKKDELRNFETILIRENDGSVTIKIVPRTDNSDTPTLLVPERRKENRADEDYKTNDVAVESEPPTRTFPGASSKVNHVETQVVSEGASRQYLSAAKLCEYMGFVNPATPENDNTVTTSVSQINTDGVDTLALPLPEQESESIRKERLRSFLRRNMRPGHGCPCQTSSLMYIGPFILMFILGWELLLMREGLLILSVVQTLIGSHYSDDCPAEPKIPKYLIVSGVLGMILYGVAVCRKYVPESKEVFPDDIRCLYGWIEKIMIAFTFPWFIFGCIWVYRIFEPEYEVKTDKHYCSKIVYLFTFWMFNIVFIVLILIIIATICFFSYVEIALRLSRHRHP